MPFKSEQQRKFMYTKHPDIAKRWQAEGAKQGLSSKPPAGNDDYMHHVRGSGGAQAMGSSTKKVVPSKRGDSPPQNDTSPGKVDKGYIPSRTANKGDKVDGKKKPPPKRH